MKRVGAASALTPVHPVALGLRFGPDHPQAGGAERQQAVGDPVDVLFYGGHHVGEHGRAAGTGHHEQVREVRHHQAEIGQRTRRPLVAQAQAVLATDVDPQHSAGHGVEPGGEDQGVQLEQGVAGLDALRRDGG